MVAKVLLVVETALGHGRECGSQTLLFGASDGPYFGTNHGVVEGAVMPFSALSSAFFSILAVLFWFRSSHLARLLFSDSLDRILMFLMGHIGHI